MYFDPRKGEEVLQKQIHMPIHMAKALLAPRSVLQQLQRLVVSASAHCSRRVSRRIICAVRAAIVSCGGLCPGENDVIQALVSKLAVGFGVPDGAHSYVLLDEADAAFGGALLLRPPPPPHQTQAHICSSSSGNILGIRYGLKGLKWEAPVPPVILTPDNVRQCGPRSTYGGHYCSPGGAEDSMNRGASSRRYCRSFILHNACISFCTMRAFLRVGMMLAAAPPLASSML